MKLVIFRTPKPRTFEYQPRYYDEREERRQRTRDIQAELSNPRTGKPDLDKVRADIRDKWQRKRSIKRRDIMGSKGMSIALAVIIVLLFLYIIFFVPIF